MMSIVVNLGFFLCFFNWVKIDCFFFHLVADEETGWYDGQVSCFSSIFVVPFVFTKKKKKCSSSLKF